MIAMTVGDPSTMAITTMMPKASGSDPGGRLLLCVRGEQPVLRNHYRQSQ